jgi:regulation of enolase protein 1 (concanavalin A-like superfamily)
MKLTGKCKEDFEKWYDMEYLFGLHHILKFTLDDFYSLPLKALQYGVYVDFFDSVGIMLSIENYHNKKSGIYYEVGWTINTREWNVMNDIQFKTRQEAQTKAIEKANKIYNETR